MLFFFNVCEEVLKIYRWIQGRLFSNVWLLGFMKRALVLFAVGAVIMIMSILIMASWFSDYVQALFSLCWLGFGRCRFYLSLVRQTHFVYMGKGACVVTASLMWLRHNFSMV